MTTLEDDLRAALRAEAESYSVPDRPALHRDVLEQARSSGRRWMVAAACLVLLAVGVVAVALQRAGDAGPNAPA